MMATIKSTELNRIGDGPVATVFSGHHAGVPVALKVYPKRFDKRTLSAYHKEQARLTALRRVTSILTVDAVDELDTGEPALRMEMCGQSLSGLIDRYGPMAPADAVLLGRAIATALAAAHERSVVHGGISPHNVLFRTNGEPVLADFGVTLRHAFARDPLHAIEFLPPETLRTGELTESSDLYGLGAILHYALTARSPHPGRLGEQPGERVLRILGEPVPAINNQEVPIGLSTLVARLLAADAGRRPNSTSMVAAQLGDMLPNPPQRTASPDFDDDFDTPMQAAPPPHYQARPRQYNDEFDDFSGQPPAQYAPPPVHQQSQWPPYPQPNVPHPARPAPQPYHPPMPPAAQFPQHGYPQPAPQPIQQMPPVAPPVLKPPPAPTTNAAQPQQAPIAPAPPPAQKPPAESQVAQQLQAPAQAPVAAETKAPPPVRQVPKVVAQPHREASAPAALAVPPAEVTPPVKSQVAQQLQAPVAPARAPVAAETKAPPPVRQVPKVVAQPHREAPAPAALAVPPVEAPAPVAPAAPPVQQAPSAEVTPPVPVVAETKAPPPVRQVPKAETQPHRRPPAPAAPSVQVASSVEGSAPVVPAPPPVQQAPSVESRVAQPQRKPAAPPALEPPTTEVSWPMPPRQAQQEFRVEPSNNGFAPDQRATTATFFPPPAEERKRRIRYDLLAGAGLVLALLALLPLLFLRNDPDELRTTPQIPEVGSQRTGDVEIILNEPVDLTNKVELSWRASIPELNFAVVIAAEGEEDVEVRMAERNLSMTVQVRPGIRYCFLVQAIEASHEDDVYQSDPRGLRGATCTQ